MNAKSIYMGIVVASLSVFVSGARADFTGNYQSLIGASPVTVGNATFSNFVFDGGTVPASDITVTITSPTDGVSTITFTAPPDGWTTNANPSLNGSSQIEWDVAFAIRVNSVELSFVATGQSGGVASVGETVRNPLTGEFASDSVTTDGSGFLPDNLSDISPLLTPALSLHVLKSIDIAGTQTATITSVENTYGVPTGGGGTPEPATLGLLSVGGLMLLKRRSRVA